VQVIREATDPGGNMDVVRSSLLAEEMTSYMRDERGRTGARKGRHDDLLMPWLIGHQAAEETPAPRLPTARASRSGRCCPGCWVWQRGVTALGYGCDKDGMAHRVYYERHKGPIPEGLYIDHLCRNPPCVNPDHLEPVTPAENIRRGRNAKLVAAQVLEIRASKESQASLAIRYGVDPSTISRAVRGDSHAGVKAHEVLHEASA
jgi:hypothetical protein